MQNKNPSIWIVILGDALALAIVVAIGLRTHQQSSLARLPLTWLPYFLAWLLAAWSLGGLTAGWRGWALPGRLLLAMVFASPLAAVLRAFWLGTSLQPLFVVIMGATAWLGLLVWRLLYQWWFVRRNG